MRETVHVSAPSRLHFGMFSFGQPEIPQFGGIGVMLDRPRVELTIQSASEFSAVGIQAARAEAIARRVWNELHRQARSKPISSACHLQIQQAIPEHAGLGSGTQLSLAITAGLLKLAKRPLLAPAEFATLAGRGLRSAVGTYGFLHGGLIVEAGKFPTETLAPLVCQVAIPESWRFVLLQSPQEPSTGEDSAVGIFGEREQAAFAELPPVPEAVTGELCREVLLQLIPAARQRDFSRFSSALYRYGTLAGECFAACQGGPFASPQLASLVETVRGLGIEGVGQSSWGPTLFALVENHAAATKLVSQLHSNPAAAHIDCLISAPASSGAQVQ